MGLKRKIANAAGATLGFIAGDIPGAMTGADLADSLYKWKYPDQKNFAEKINMGKYVKSGSKRKASKQSGGKRRKVSKYSGNKKVEKMRNNNMNQTNLTNTHIKKKDTLKMRKSPYKVRVSSAFRKKVIKAVSDKEPQGSATLTFIGGFFPPNGNVGWPVRDSVSKQWVFGLPMGNQATSATAYSNGANIRSGDVFRTNMLLHVASRMWNGAAKATNFNEFGYDRLDNFCNPETSVGALKLDILKSWAVIEMKNVTRTKLRLYMYVCKPKYQRRTADFNARVDGVNSGIPTQFTEFGTNISGVQASTYGIFPEMTPAWKRQWEFEKYEIVLEPGQEHRHTINGYCGQFDFLKAYKDSVHQNVQPIDRHVFFVMQTDLGIVREGTPAVSYGVRTAQDSDDASLGLGILFETKVHWTLQMPEPAGARMPATGLLGVGAYNKPAGFRKRCYLYDIIDDTDLPNQTEVVNIDDNNPTVVVA
ncbi:putative capsid protein [Diporeia-associated CRESS-DNA virus LH481]|nr:putative capsid protein [Diporeia-associated CRESS-DNA virus LH481]